MRSRETGQGTLLMSMPSISLIFDSEEPNESREVVYGTASHNAVAKTRGKGGGKGWSGGGNRLNL